VISQVLAEPSTVGAAITWRTDKPATTRVEYGLTAAYGSFSPLFTELYPIHAVNLSQLQPATTYHFRVLSRDEYGIEGVSQDYTFTTLNDTAPPNTSFAGGPADNSFVCQLPAVFQFSGSDDATPATSLEFAYQIDDGPWSAFGTPSATVTGLSEGWHVIRARARDQAGNVDASPTVRNFHISTDGPTLSGVTATPGPGSFTIRWETVEPSTSQVEYGSSASYGSQTPVGSPWSPSRGHGHWSRAFHHFPLPCAVVRYLQSEHRLRRRHGGDRAGSRPAHHPG